MSLNDVPPSLRFGAPEFVFEEDHSAGRDPAAAGRSRDPCPYQTMRSHCLSGLAMQNYAEGSTDAYSGGRLRF
jgi:ribosome modulation factor